MFESLLSDGTFTGCKILIVDDEPLLAQTLQKQLEENHYRTITASNSKDGLQKALTEKPDIILLDVMMPTMAGLEMLENLRRTVESKDISVIMLTTRDNPRDIALAAACGIDDFIIKPFKMSTLLGKIESILESRYVRWKNSNLLSR